MDINKIKWASSDTALKAPITGTQKSRGWDTDDGTITGTPEKPNLQQTNGWMNAVYKWLDYINTIRTPLGTILVSALDEQKFNSITSGSWVLCDGRNIAGSQLSILTGVSVAPDLRGYILGGAGTSSIDLDGNTVEDIGSLNTFVDENVSIRSLNMTTEGGDTAIDIGNKELTVEYLTWGGTSSATNNDNKTRIRLSSGHTPIDQAGLERSRQGEDSGRFDILEAQAFNSKSKNAKNPTPFTFNANNYGHTHTYEGQLTGRNITGATVMGTTPENVRNLYSEPNTEEYEFIPASVGVSYYLRIN